MQIHKLITSQRTPE